MADSDLIEALADCLDALRRGELDLQVCLARHGRYRAELEALLEVARLIPRLPASVVPSPSFRERTRRGLMRGTGDDATISGASWRDTDPSQL